MKTCGLSGCLNTASSSKYNIDWCSDHQYYGFNVLRPSFLGPFVAKGLEDGFMTHTEGLVYVIALPNGNIKIGTTADIRTLRNRMLKFTEQFAGDIEILAVLEHGRTLETLLHHRFAEYRIFEQPHEQFRNVSAIQEYAEDESIPVHIRQQLLDLPGVCVVG